MTRSFVPLPAVVTFLLFSLCAPTAQGLVMELLPLQELTRRVDLVVRGRVVSQSAAREAPGKDIWTTTTLRVVQTLKGPSVPETLRFRQIGGTVDGVTEMIPGDAAFRPGEEVIVFLARTPRGLVLYGFSQGKFTVRFDPVIGARVVDRDLSHAGLVSRDGSLPRYAPARLDDFVAEVQSYAAPR